MPGSRPGPPATTESSAGPLSCTSGTSSTTPATKRSRSAATRAARSTRPETLVVVATASAVIAATSRVPERDVALLPAAVQQRGALGVAAQHEHPGAHRPAELVPGHGQRVDPAGRDVDRDLANGLHGVGVQRDADGVRGRRAR